MSISVLEAAHERSSGHCSKSAGSGPAVLPDNNTKEELICPLTEVELNSFPWNQDSQLVDEPPADSSILKAKSLGDDSDVVMECPDVGVVMECPDVGDQYKQEAGVAPCEQPKAKKQKPAAGRNKDQLLPNPPTLPEDVLNEIKSRTSEALGSSTHVETSVESQRQLKKRLEEEENEKKDDAKEKAAQKKKTAADKALEKAREKLEKAEAKVMAVQQKMARKGRGAKRTLEPEFKAVAEHPQTAKQAGGTPVKKSEPSKQKQESPSAAFKLSPKAKAFAANSHSPLHAPAASKRKASSANKAQHALETLRGLNIDGLKLPGADFAKKFLSSNMLNLRFN